jgi:hypothetical protein
MVLGAIFPAITIGDGLRSRPIQRLATVPANTLDPPDLDQATYTSKLELRQKRGKEDLRF